MFRFSNFLVSLKILKILKARKAVITLISMLFDNDVYAKRKSNTPMRILKITKNPSNKLKPSLTYPLGPKILSFRISSKVNTNVKNSSTSLRNFSYDGVFLYLSKAKHNVFKRIITKLMNSKNGVSIKVFYSDCLYLELFYTSLSYFLATDLDSIDGLLLKNLSSDFFVF